MSLDTVFAAFAEVPVWMRAAGCGALAGLATAFVVINAGLRLIPEGRAFLAEARGRGRALASPTRRSPTLVKAIFAAAWACGIAAGFLAYARVAELNRPLSLPDPIRIADCRQC